MHPARKIYIFFSLLLGLICYAELRAQNALPFLKPTAATQLDEQVRETSGLLYFDNSFWTINDSGNENILYRINLDDGSISQKITISNAKNIDWEEITADSNYIYIGDIGDNSHLRDEKQIYRIAKSAILKNSKDRAIEAEVISFRYPKTADKGLNFDAEAFVSDGGNIHIFTKDLFVSNHFTIPASPGSYTAKYIDKLAVNGQVAGATLDAKTHSLLLTGYFAFGKRLLWKISDYKNQAYFSGKMKTYSLGDLSLTSQVESVCLDKNGKIYFSNENFGKVKQHLWVLDDDLPE